MIYRTIDITNQKPISVKIPESWEDVTFKQLRDIDKETDSLARLSILTGVPTYLFDKYPELADFYVWLETNLEWSNDWDVKDSDSEVFLLDDSSTFYFPKDVGVLSIGLYKDMQKEAQDNKDDIMSIYPLICASYYQLLKDGKYDYIKAAEYVEMFENQPCRKVYNAAGFFLNKINELRNGTPKSLRSRATHQIKRWLGSIGFQRYLGLKLSTPN